MGMEPAVVLNPPITVADSQPESNNRLRDSVLYSGRLEAEKGIFELLESFQTVLAKIPQAKLYLAGEGSIKGGITAYINEQRLTESVNILGLLSRDEMAAWYGKVQIVVVPSLWPEPFGRVGPEAMSHGVPVIASGTGGMTDWLNMAGTA